MAKDDYDYEAFAERGPLLDLTLSSANLCVYPVSFGGVLLPAHAHDPQLRRVHLQNVSAVEGFGSETKTPAGSEKRGSGEEQAAYA